MSKKTKVKTNVAEGRPGGKELLRVLTALTTMDMCNVRAKEAMYFISSWRPSNVHQVFL
jgi:hypothetical protein